MKRIGLLLFTVLCVTMTVLAFAPEVQAYTLKTTYNVEIHEDGSASWVIGQSAYLQTADDETSFKQLISRAIVYIDQFASEVSTIINQAHDSTGRFMTAEHITVGGNVTESNVGAYGFLEYSFDWTNFAVVGSTKMTIGDAFSNKSFTFGGGGLSILLPTGYTVKSCAPSPDHNSDNFLEWNTVLDLPDGQPLILLSKAEGMGLLPAFPVLFGALLVITGAVLSSVLILRVRKKRSERAPGTIVDETVREVEDSERILALLKSGGGQALQSKITEQLKCSKAKTSRILGDMENKGIIKRYKSGRDKVVSIRRETEKTRS